MRSDHATAVPDRYHTCWLRDQYDEIHRQLGQMQGPVRRHAPRLAATQTESVRHSSQQSAARSIAIARLPREVRTIQTYSAGLCECRDPRHKQHASAERACVLRCRSRALQRDRQRLGFERAEETLCPRVLPVLAANRSTTLRNRVVSGCRTETTRQRRTGRMSPSTARRHGLPSASRPQRQLSEFEFRKRCHTRRDGIHASHARQTEHSSYGDRGTSAAASAAQATSARRRKASRTKHDSEHVRYRSVVSFEHSAQDGGRTTKGTVSSTIHSASALSVRNADVRCCQTANRGASRAGLLRRRL